MTDPTFSPHCPDNYTDDRATALLAECQVNLIAARNCLTRYRITLRLTSRPYINGASDGLDAIDKALDSTAWLEQTEIEEQQPQYEIQY